jgi:hypothetical protein
MDEPDTERSKALAKPDRPASAATAAASSASMPSASASSPGSATMSGTTTKVRRPAEASSMTKAHRRSSESGWRIAVRTGSRPAGADRRSETSRSA